MKRLDIFAVIAAVSMAGCWTLGGGGGGDDGPVPIEEMPQAIAGVFCGLVDQCMGPGFFGAGDCENTFAAQFEDSTVPRMQDAIDRGTLDYDADKMRDCLDAMGALGCGALDQSEAPAACEEAMVGSVQTNGSCFIDEECAGSAFCDEGASCPGVCENYLAVNDDCSMGGKCGGATTCFNGVCTALSQAGQPCGGGLHAYCDGGLDCEGEDFETPGTCRADPAPTLAGVDQACNPEMRQLCQSGLSCVITSLEGGEMAVWECKAGVGSGAVCSFGAPDQCPAAEYCAGQLTPTSLEGICTPLPGENQPCADSMMSEGCQPGTECMDGICFRPKRLTEGCSSDWDCVSDFCDESAMTCAVEECG